MIKGFHKQFNYLMSTNSTSAPSDKSTVEVSIPNPSPVQKNYKINSYTKSFAVTPGEDLENWIFLITGALKLVGEPDYHKSMAISTCVKDHALTMLKD